jgi:hypothetical protein
MLIGRWKIITTRIGKVSRKQRRETAARPDENFLPHRPVFLDAGDDEIDEVRQRRERAAVGCDAPDRQRDSTRDPSRHTHEVCLDARPSRIENGRLPIFA